MNFIKSSSLKLINLSIVSTLVGISVCIFKVSGFSKSASLLSTWFMQYDFICLRLSSVISPLIITSFAVFIIGLSPSFIIWIHWAAQSALRSYCPGKYSIANTLSSVFMFTSSWYTLSVLGSENIFLTTFSYTDSSIPSISYLFKSLRLFIPSIFKLSSISHFRCFASKSNPCFSQLIFFLQ